MEVGILQLVVTHVLAARAGTWALQTVTQRARRGKPALTDRIQQQQQPIPLSGEAPGTRGNSVSCYAALKPSRPRAHHRQSSTRTRGRTMAHPISSESNPVPSPRQPSASSRAPAPAPAPSALALPAPFASATHAASIKRMTPKRQPAQPPRPPQHAAITTAWILGGAYLPWAGRHPLAHHNPPMEDRLAASHPDATPPAPIGQPTPPQPSRPPNAEQGFTLSPEGILAGLVRRPWPPAAQVPEPPVTPSSFHFEGQPWPLTPSLQQQQGGEGPDPGVSPSHPTSLSSSSSSAVAAAATWPQSPPHLVGDHAIGGGGGSSVAGGVLPGAHSGGNALGGLMEGPVRGLRQLNQVVAASVSEFLSSDPGRRMTEQVAAEMSSGALMVPVYLTEELVKARLKSLLASHARWLIVQLAIRVSVASALVYGIKALVRSLVRKRGPRWLRRSATFCCDVMLPTSFFGPLLGVTATVVQFTGLGPFIRGAVASAAGTAVKTAVAAGTTAYTGARVATVVRGGDVRQGGVRRGGVPASARGSSEADDGGGGGGAQGPATAAVNAASEAAAAAAAAWVEASSNA